MGLANEQGGGRFINIIDGKLTIKADKGDEGAVSRINKKGVEVWEKRYNAFTAKLVDISTRDGDYGKEWIFSFQDSGDMYRLQLSYSNGLAQAFLKMLPNIDVTKEMKIQTSVKEEDGVRKQSLFVSQDGNTIKHAHTRENPNGMPDLVKVKVNGAEQWDSTERMEWFEKTIVAKVLPTLPKIEATAGDKKSALAIENNLADHGDQDDF